VATDELYSTRLQGLNAGVLIHRILIAGILGIVARRAGLAGVKNVSQSRAPGLGIIYFDPLSHPIFLPNVVAIVQNVGLSIQSADDLNLIDGDSVAEAKPIQTILGVPQESAAIDGIGMDDLLDAAR